MVTLGQADLRDDAQPPATATPPLPLPQAASPGASPQGLREAVESYERHLIDASLQRHHGSWAAAARELQMDRRQPAAAGAAAGTGMRGHAAGPPP